MTLSLLIDAWAPVRARGRAGGAPAGLVVMAGFVGLLAATPLVYLLLRAVQAPPGTWWRLWDGRLLTLAADTMALVLVTATIAGLLGLSLAWLVERTDLPGRGVWRWVLALPMAVPGYIGAMCYLILLRRGGLVEQALIRGLGWEPGRLALPSLHSVGAVAIIISLFTFPLVFLPVAAALRSANATYEEAARVSGRTVWGSVRAVVVPLLAPALLAGVMLVGLYVLSDFGTVALLRYRTFTVAIYSQFVGQVDRSGAAILSFVLVFLALPLLAAEAWLGRRARRYGAAGGWRPPRPIPLGRWRLGALALVVAVAGLSLGLPLALLAGLTVRGWLVPTTVDAVWRVGSASLWRNGWNTLAVAVIAASLATVLALAPATLTTRFHARGPLLLGTVGKAGIALPGLIAALSLVMLFSRWLPALYGTVVVLVLGFGVRFLPQALSLGEAALRGVPDSSEHAAHVLGAGPWRTLRSVTLPMAAPGLVAAWTVVFLSATKELPTALLLRPPGFDTLPVRIWAAAGESVYTQAAPPALLLLLITTATVGWLVRRAHLPLGETPP